MDQKELEKLFGVRYLNQGDRDIIEAHPNDAYFYTTYFGKHRLSVELGDSVWWLASLADGVAEVRVANGPMTIESELFATVIRGYRTVAFAKSVKFFTSTNLPYVNGCSTAQVVPPDRPGDPTWQLLKIPPFSSEQAHHIHSTVRIVYVLDGHGYSVVGMKDNCIRQELNPGMLVMLNKMAPHHFETPQGEWLTVIPIHGFSALPGGLENNHPMFNGTFLMNQGQ